MICRLHCTLNGRYVGSRSLDRQTGSSHIYLTIGTQSHSRPSLFCWLWHTGLRCVLYPLVWATCYQSFEAVYRHQSCEPTTTGPWSPGSARSASRQLLSTRLWSGMQWSFTTNHKCFMFISRRQFWRIQFQLIWDYLRLPLPPQFIFPTETHFYTVPLWHNCTQLILPDAC